jgi:hypothetical protein
VWVPVCAEDSEKKVGIQGRGEHNGKLGCVRKAKTGGGGCKRSGGVQNCLGYGYTSTMSYICQAVLKSLSETSHTLELWRRGFFLLLIVLGPSKDEEEGARQEDHGQSQSHMATHTMVNCPQVAQPALPTSMLASCNVQGRDGSRVSRVGTQGT